MSQVSHPTHRSLSTKEINFKDKAKSILEKDPNAIIDFERGKHQRLKRLIENTMAEFNSNDLARIQQRFGITISSSGPFTWKYLRVMNLAIRDMLYSDIEKINERKPKNVKELMERIYERTFAIQEPHLAQSFYRTSAEKDRCWEPEHFTMDESRHYYLNTLLEAFKNEKVDNRDFFLELLVKRIITLHPEVGTLIPGPHQPSIITSFKSKPVYQQYYYTYAIISHGGLQAYAFVPVGKGSTLVPILAFQGTVMDYRDGNAVKTWANDMGGKIGEKGYRAAHYGLEILIDDPDFCRRHEKFVVVGYSLGGVHAQRFIAEYPDRVMEAHFFNSPGIDRATAQEFAGKCDSLEKELKLYYYDANGDFIFCAGDAHIGYNIDKNHPKVSVLLKRYTFCLVENPSTLVEKVTNTIWDLIKKFPKEGCSSLFNALDAKYGVEKTIEAALTVHTKDFLKGGYEVAELDRKELDNDGAYQWVETYRQMIVKGEGFIGKIIDGFTMSGLISPPRPMYNIANANLHRIPEPLDLTQIQFYNKDAKEAYDRLEAIRKANGVFLSRAVQHPNLKSEGQMFANAEVDIRSAQEHIILIDKENDLLRKSDKKSRMVIIGQVSLIRDLREELTFVNKQKEEAQKSSDSSNPNPTPSTSGSPRQLEEGANIQQQTELPRQKMSNIPKRLPSSPLSNESHDSKKFTTMQLVLGCTATMAVSVAGTALCLRRN